MPFKSGSVSTDGVTLFSYAPAIAVRVDGEDRIVVNVTKYSATTSRLQRAIERAHPAALRIEVEADQRGVDRDDLLKLAAAKVRASLRVVRAALAA